MDQFFQRLFEDVENKFQILGWIHVKVVYDRTKGSGFKLRFYVVDKSKISTELWLMLFVLMFDRTSRILAEFWPNSRFEVRSNIIWSSAVHYITIVSFSKNHYTTHNRHVLLTQINWNLCLVMEYGICSHTNFFFFFYSTNIEMSLSFQFL